MASGAVERYLLEFNEALVAGGERRERILAEVEEHLRDATQSLLAAGRTADEAQVEAVARFGSPAEAAERFGPDPLGRAQRASRWYEARRIAHPWALPVIVVAPWVALILSLSGWSSGSRAWMLASMLAWLWSMISSNATLRRRAGVARTAPVSRFLDDRQRLKSALLRARVALVAGVLIFFIFHGTTAWYQAISVFYLVCAAAAIWARPGRCADPACRNCGTRWTVRHATTGAAVRYGAWALALAGPALAQVVPVADSRTGTALLFLAPFACLPLPSCRARTWLWRRRPAKRIALSATPVLIMLACYAVVRPEYWFILATAGGVALLFAIQSEILAGRNREDQTRRHLHARAHGVPGNAQQ
ncbi:MAG: permease prefix domain 1-containing protein [Actinomycetota bacterium]|nr:permease prefix domain 1-containing protein [Actinomycetota bacterium]